MARIQRVEPCHHCWAYYERKVRERRGKRLKCNRLENQMWDYSMHAAFPMGVVQGAAPDAGKKGADARSPIIPGYALTGWETDGRVLSLPVGNHAK